MEREALEAGALGAEAAGMGVGACLR